MTISRIQEINFLETTRIELGAAGSEVERKEMIAAAATALLQMVLIILRTKKVQTYFCGRFHPLFACLANGQLAREKFKQL